MKLIADNIVPDSITRFFLADPSLVYLGLPDDDLVSLCYEKRYIPKENSIYKGMYNVDTDELVGIMKLELFTDVSVNIHLYLLTGLHHQGYSKAIGQACYDYVRDYCPNIHKIILMAPESCEHVHKAAERFGMNLEGKLTKVLMWRKKLQDVLLYAINVDRGE